MLSVLYACMSINAGCQGVILLLLVPLQEPIITVRVPLSPYTSWPHAFSCKLLAALVGVRCSAAMQRSPINAATSLLYLLRCLLGTKTPVPLMLLTELAAERWESWASGFQLS